MLNANVQYTIFYVVGCQHFPMLYYLQPMLAQTLPALLTPSDWLSYGGQVEAGDCPLTYTPGLGAQFSSNQMSSEFLY